MSDPASEAGSSLARAGAGCGFYGKVPSAGDFVARRLPWAFIAPWDDWLQRGLQVARTALGAHWPGRYLRAPIWRFQLGPGICGPQAWRGLLLPSGDRVGRHFPLTLAFADPCAAAAAAAAAAPSLAALSADDPAWRVLEDAALAALAPTLSIEAIDGALRALPIPAFAAAAHARRAQPQPPSVCLYAPAAGGTSGRALSLPTLPPPAAFVGLLAAAEVAEAAASLGPAAPAVPAVRPGELPP